jgi:hypothetical protein
MLIIHGHHHPRTDVDRLYDPRKEGRVELIQTEGSYIAGVMKLMEYVKSKVDSLIKIVT